MYLHVVEGMPYAEIGEHLDLTESSVRVIALRARRRLRGQLDLEDQT